jgi:23S rRNA pseudouridine2604 synthase
MPGTPRKPLGLPRSGQGAQAELIPAGTGRRPVRGGALKRKSAAEVAETNAAYAAKARAMQEKPRGTPSRAPVAIKTTTTPRPPPTPAFENKTVQSGVRISKLMAERGLCSRRDADEYIGRGWVFVDGLRVTELGTRADPAVKITLGKEAQIQQTWQMTILLHKPVGYVSGQPEPGFTPAVTLIQPETQFSTVDTPAFHPRHLKGLAPAGRLDIDSTGLLVLTQDGRVARQLIGEDSQVDKEYLVRVEGRLSEQGLAQLNHGLSLDGRKLKPAKVEWLNEDQLRFVLREGRKRQIRRMCELVGLKVVGLKRVRIGGIKLGDLPPGQWRFLREDERF